MSNVNRRKLRNLSQRTAPALTDIVHIWSSITGKDHFTTVNDLLAAIGGFGGVYLGTADVTGVPIILDFDGNVDALFNATGTINVNKTLQFNNASLGRRMKLLLTIASGPVLTLPSNIKFPGYQSGWNDGTKQLEFAQIGDGDFEIEFAYKTVGTYWQAKLHGPF